MYNCTDWKILSSSNCSFVALVHKSRISSHTRQICEYIQSMLLLFKKKRERYYNRNIQNENLLDPKLYLNILAYEDQSNTFALLFLNNWNNLQKNALSRYCESFKILRTIKY